MKWCQVGNIALKIPQLGSNFNVAILAFKPEKSILLILLIETSDKAAAQIALNN